MTLVDCHGHHVRANDWEGGMGECLPPHPQAYRDMGRRKSKSPKVPLSVLLYECGQLHLLTAGTAMALMREICKAMLSMCHRRVPKGWKKQPTSLHMATTFAKVSWGPKSYRIAALIMQKIGEYVAKLPPEIPAT